MQIFGLNAGENLAKPRRAKPLGALEQSADQGAVIGQHGIVAVLVEIGLGDGDLIAGDATIWEHEPLEHLARSGELMAYKHDGFWQPMDTLREKRLLDELWETGKAPWKVL